MPHGPVSGIGILLNSGRGAFVASTYTAGPSPNFLLLADLNGDGLGSLVVSDDAGGIRVISNDGMGQFGGTTGGKTYAAGSSRIPSPAVTSMAMERPTSSWLGVAMAAEGLESFSMSGTGDSGLPSSTAGTDTRRPSRWET
jgi:hypothetical protein